MKRVLFWFLLAATTAFGQERLGPVRTGYVALHVKDLSVSSRFYADVLTLSPIPVPANLKASQVWFNLGNDQQLHLISGRTEEIVNDRNGSHIALYVNSINRAEQYLRRRNLTYARQTGPDDQLQLFVADPDGYLFGLNQVRKARTFGEIASQGLKSVVSSIIE
ncbi:MAG: glyoxalase [Bacteroidetes bacterium]|nr:glyoxalase [Fibrella sp.]